jgi:hypothetical protein
MQAASGKLRATSIKRQAASSKLLDIIALDKDTRGLEARDFTKINVFLGCLIWKAI